MSVKTYESRVNDFRWTNPDCNYCISNKYYGIIGRVAECNTRQISCWESKKIAKKCSLYEFRPFDLREIKL